MSRPNVFSWARTRLRARSSKDQLTLDTVLEAIGALHAAKVSGEKLSDIRHAEFRVFSQYGEDGIIQHLISRVPIQRSAFVEIGVESYRESNTRFLLIHDNWEGAIFDVGNDHLRFLQQSGLSWRHSISAESLLLTRENVNDALERAGMTGDIGLLSIDIDGNDFWLIDAITVAQPRIIVAEYNSLFGPNLAVTVPYDPRFGRSRAHYSHLYFGASIAALAHVARRKGYRLIGTNSVGSNVFFVRNDVAGDLPDLDPEEAYVRSRFRQARGPRGKLLGRDDHDLAPGLIGDLPVHDVVTGNTLRLSSVWPREGAD